MVLTTLVVGKQLREVKPSDARKICVKIMNEENKWNFDNIFFSNKLTKQGSPKAGTWSREPVHKH